MPQKKEGRRCLNVYMAKELYANFRNIAFRKEKKMAEIARKLIQNYVKKDGGRKGD